MKYIEDFFDILKIFVLLVIRNCNFAAKSQNLEKEENPSELFKNYYRVSNRDCICNTVSYKQFAAIFLFHSRRNYILLYFYIFLSIFSLKSGIYS